MEAKDVVVSSQLHVYLDYPESTEEQEEQNFYYTLDNESAFCQEILERTGIMVNHMEEEQTYVEVYIDYEDIKIPVKALEAIITDVFAKHVYLGTWNDTGDWVPIEWKSGEITPLPLAA